MSNYDEWWAKDGCRHATGNTGYILARLAYNAGLAARAPEAVGGEVERLREGMRQIIEDYKPGSIAASIARQALATPATPSPVAPREPVCGPCGGTKLYVGPSAGTTFGPAVTCPYCRPTAPTPSPVGAREPVWPPRAGDLVKHRDGDVCEFTGEQNYSGGYEVVDRVTRKPNGGLSKRAIDSGMFMLLGPPPVGAPTEAEARERRPMCRIGCDLGLDDHDAACARSPGHKGLCRCSEHDGETIDAPVPSAPDGGASPPPTAEDLLPDCTATEHQPYCRHAPPLPTSLPGQPGRQESESVASPPLTCETCEGEGGVQVYPPGEKSCKDCEGERCPQHMPTTKKCTPCRGTGKRDTGTPTPAACHVGDGVCHEDAPCKDGDCLMLRLVGQAKHGTTPEASDTGTPTPLTWHLPVSAHPLPPLHLAVRGVSSRGAQGHRRPRHRNTSWGGAAMKWFFAGSAFWTVESVLLALAATAFKPWHGAMPDDMRQWFVMVSVASLMAGVGIGISLSRVRRGTPGAGEP